MPLFLFSLTLLFMPIQDANSLIHPSSVGTRETLLYEQALETVYGRPYALLLSDALNGGTVDARDLLHLGKRLFMDFVRLARGEISSIRVPATIPARDTFLRSAPSAACNS